MSPLPQRKKSTEELNRLRHRLGVHSQPPASPAAPMREIQAPPPVAPAVPPGPPRPPKPVRSLRKSERQPALQSRAKQNASASSKIPAQRHNANEIQEIRRRDAISRFSAEEHPLPFPLPAPRWITIPGYLIALSGFACQYWTGIPLSVTACAAGLALLVCLYILLRRPLSRHHAGFLAIITLFALVFAALHYFPQLRHAS